MSLWGKMAGIAAGYALGGVPGALFGGLVGHFFMDRLGDDDVAFTIALIALAAKMTRADGSVAPIEIEAVHQVLRVPEKERVNMERVFRLAQGDVAGFDAYARQISDLYRDRPQVLEDVLDALLFIAYADGILHPAEKQFLEIVAEIFEIDKARFAMIASRHGQGEIKDPYLVLGETPSASDSTIRAAYYRAVRENHPDQLQARGMPQEMLHVATARMAAINEAWEMIKEVRKL
jgi:DnaJ like chaperone protein